MSYEPLSEDVLRAVMPLVSTNYIDNAGHFKANPMTPEAASAALWRRIAGATPRATSVEQRRATVWVLRRSRVLAGYVDPDESWNWPGCVSATGPRAAREGWPLDPYPGKLAAPQTKSPKPNPTKLDGTIEGRQVKPGDVVFWKDTPGNEPVRGARRVVQRVERNKVWFANQKWGSLEDLTFEDPTAHQAAQDELNRNFRDWIFSPKVTTEANTRRERLPPIQLDLSSLERRITAACLDLAAPYGTAFGATPDMLSAFLNHKQPANQGTSTMNQGTSTMNQVTAQQATPSTAASLNADTSNIVETKTYVFGRDIKTLDDDTLLNYVQSLTGAIEYLEQLNAETPLAKLVTKIGQLRDAKAKIVELLGGAPVEQATPQVNADDKPKRVRRTKAEIEADATSAPTPLTPPPAAKGEQTPDLDDVDLE